MSGVWSRVVHALRVVIDGPATTRINDELRRACLIHYETDKATCRGCAKEREDES